MNRLSILQIIRVHIVAGGVLAFSLGVLLAIVDGGILNPIHVVLGYSVVLLGDLSTHYSNDYFDVDLDRQSKTKKFFSSKKTLVKKPQLRPLTKNISLTLLALSIIMSALVVLFFGAPIEFFVITLAANLLGWAYSAPPLRLSSKGLGELAIATATGFIIPSIGYLSVKNQFSPLFISLSIPFMMYGFFLSLNLEAPDIENDQNGKKRTLAVRTGKRNVFFIVLAVPFLATLTFFGIMLQTVPNIIDLRVVFLISFMPLVAGLVGFVTSFQKKDLNRFCTLNIFSLFLFITLLNMYCYLVLP